MPPEPRTVEVVCEGTHVEFPVGYPFCVDRECDGSRVLKMRAAPGSITEGRLRLADAAEAKGKAYRARMARITSGEDCSVDRVYHEALAAEELAEEQEEDAYESLAALRAKRAEG